MYVDELGVESVYDNTKFFVTAGAIFHENDLSTMKTEIQNYKDANFSGVYQDAEIHLQHIFKGRGKFFGLNLSQKIALLNPLYSTLHNLPFTIISIAIDKQKFIQKHHAREILDYGHMLLVERFDNFLVEHDNKGIIRIDRTTAPNKVDLNQKDADVLKLINKIRKNGTRWQSPAISIVEEPHFLASHLRKGLQIADAVGYCINRKINNYSDFDIFWNEIYPKFRTSSDGNVMVFEFIQNKGRRYMIT